MFQGRKNSLKVIAVAIMVGLLIVSCWGGNDGAGKAVPSFCPIDYASNLSVIPDGNIPPKAYYQDLDTTMGTDLDITLFACDPDDPATAAGMTWTVITGPFSGSLSAVSGTYSAQPYQVTYSPGAAGTDSFFFLCLDAEGAISNVAEIRINVDPPPLTGQVLFFGGKDDMYRTHLWYYDGSSPIATVSGSAQALSQYGLTWFDSGLPDPGGIHFLVSDSSGENLHPLGFNAGTQSFREYPEIDNAGEQIPYGPLLYVTGNNAGGGTSYLWYSGSGGFSPIPATANMGPYDLTVFNGKLYFGGDSGGGNVQVMSYNSSGGIVLQETFTATSLWPRDLTVCNGKLYFNGTLAGPPSYEFLWATDGASPATTPTYITYPENMICFNNELYFTAKGASGSTMSVQLWSLSSSDVLTRWSANAFVDFMGTYSETYPVIAGSTLYMRGTDDTFTNWIWAADGSSPITTVPGSDGLYPFYTTVFDGKLYFSSSATAYDQLWSYDPGTGSLGAISNISMGLYPQGFVVYTP